MEYLKYLFGRLYFHLTNHFRPLIVHTEAIFIDEVWEKIKSNVKQRKVLKWYVMTPVNYDYFKVFFDTKLTKKELEKILKKRYQWLIQNNQNVQLHIHLSKLMIISYSEQKKMISEGVNWFEKELGFRPKEFVPGWWSYNKDTLKILKEYGLEMIKERDYKSIHDYNWAL